MAHRRITQALIKTVIGLCILRAHTYGLGIQGSTGGLNNLFEIIVDDHIVENENGLRGVYKARTEVVYIEDNSDNNPETEKADLIKDNSNVRSNVGTPRYVDNGPPPYTESARMARYIVHYSEWTSIATICSRDPLKGHPFSNIFSVSDGSSVANSSGVPYFYVPSIEMSVHDLKHDSRISATMSLAQGDYCRQSNLDPEDPRCAHVIISGRFMPIKKGSKEENFAKDALFSRHPAMKDWNSPSHGWFFAKVNITNILLLDYFGGAATIPVKDYFNATPY